MKIFFLSKIDKSIEKVYEELASKNIPVKLGVYQGYVSISTINKMHSVAMCECETFCMRKDISGFVVNAKGAKQPMRRLPICKAYMNPHKFHLDSEHACPDLWCELEKDTAAVLLLNLAEQIAIKNGRDVSMKFNPSDDSINIFLDADMINQKMISSAMTKYIENSGVFEKVVALTESMESVKTSNGSDERILA